MKLLVLAVLLAIMQTVPPVPRKTADDPAQTTTDVKSKSAPDQAKSQPAPAPAKADSNGPAKTSGDEQHSEDTQQTVGISKLPAVTVNPVKRDWADWAYWLFNLFLVAVGALQVVLLCYTLKEVRRQRIVMSYQWRTMSKQLKEMAAQTALLDKYVGHTENTAIAAKQSADAAKISADVAAGVSVPTLVVHEFTTGDVGGAALSAILQFPKINLVVKNYGQTPAFLKWWCLLFTCEELPDIPIYSGQPVCGIVLTKEVVQPNQSYTLTVLNSWNRQEFSLEDVQAIIDRRKILNAYGYVCYGDIFGHPLRRLKFCETALNLGDGWIDWRSEFAPDAYVGTDRFPSKKTHDQPEEAN